MRLRSIIVLLVCGLFFASCATKPECRTRAGKKKKKYYNSIQYR